MMVHPQPLVRATFLLNSASSTNIHYYLNFALLLLCASIPPQGDAQVGEDEEGDYVDEGEGEEDDDDEEAGEGEDEAGQQGECGHRAFGAGEWFSPRQSDQSIDPRGLSSWEWRGCGQVAG